MSKQLNHANLAISAALSFAPGSSQAKNCVAISDYILTLEALVMDFCSAGSETAGSYESLLERAERLGLCTKPTPTSPFLKFPELEAELREHCRVVCEKSKDNWEGYFYASAADDGWNDPIEKLSEEKQKSLEAWFEFNGQFPTPDYIEILSEEEIKVFGKSVEDEL